MGKRVLPAVNPALSGAGLQPSPPDHFLLHLHEALAGNDGLVASFHVILRNDPLIGDPLLIQEVRGDCLLQKRITDLFFIPKYTGVDTMCAVGANGCIVGASMGASMGAP